MSLFSQFSEYLHDNGCSPFFFTSAIQSAAFGEIGRLNQASLLNGNLEFRDRFQSIKDQYSKERLDQQLLFKRESYELGKQYLIQQTAAMNESRQQEIEFQYFCENCWPLETSVYAILKEQNKILGTSSIVPMNVLIARTEISASDRAHTSYNNFCQSVKNELSEVPDVNVYLRPWQKMSQSIVGDSMNINYIMRGMPTLLVFPYQIGDTLGIEISVWSFSRNRKSMYSQKIFAKSGIDSTEKIPIAVTAIKSIAGMVRDSYMISEYRKPAVYLGKITEKELAVPEIREMVLSHYKSLNNLVENDETYLSLCTDWERGEIESSIKHIKQIAVK